MSDLITLRVATLPDYPLVQNMARFYVYDMSRECSVEEGWYLPGDGLYECVDLKSYFVNQDRTAYLIYVEDEVAGFAMVNKVGAGPYVDWNMGEFFILAKFQGRGIGKAAATHIFNQHPGMWNVMVMPLNQSAYLFWKRVIEDYGGQPLESIPHMVQDPHPHVMNVFEFQVFQ